MEYWLYRLDIGTVGISERSGALSHIWFVRPGTPLPFPEPGSTRGETPLLAEAAGQIRRYLAGDLFAFDLPLAPQGTPFVSVHGVEAGRSPPFPSRGLDLWS